MVADARAASNAYKMLANLGDQLGAGKTAVPEDESNGVDFGGMVKDVVSQFAGQAKAVDNQSAALAAGKADLIDVVSAVAETEVALETLVSVRDKVIAAYEEIMRMPI